MLHSALTKLGAPEAGSKGVVVGIAGILDFTGCASMMHACRRVSLSGILLYSSPGAD